MSAFCYNINMESDSLDKIKKSEMQFKKIKIKRVKKCKNTI